MRPEPENPPGALAYFTQTAILRQIGFRRLGQLLNPFAADLKAVHFALPEPDSDDYFPDLANALSVTERLPKSVLTILRTLENAVSPANNEQLRSAIQRRIPHVSLSEGCALDRALELWFCAPDEFSPFLPASDIGGESAPASDQAQLNTSAPQSANEGALVLNGNGQTNHSAASDEEAFNGLARLSAVEYDRARPAEAARLGLRKETLDSEVARRRPLSDDAQARAVHLPAIEPWPLPVNGAEMLDQVAARYALHLALPLGAADVLALWTEQAHACPAFAHTPRLKSLLRPTRLRQDHHSRSAGYHDAAAFAHRESHRPSSLSPHRSAPANPAPGRSRFLLAAGRGTARPLERRTQTRRVRLPLRR